MDIDRGVLPPLCDVAPLRRLESTSDWINSQARPLGCRIENLRVRMASVEILKPQGGNELRDLMDDTIRRWHGRGLTSVYPAPSNPDRCTDGALVEALARVRPRRTSRQSPPRRRLPRRSWRSIRSWRRSASNCRYRCEATWPRPTVRP